MRVWLVVERRYFAEAVAPVERLRFGEGFIGFEPEQRKPPFPREAFEAEEDPGPKAETTGGGRDPHTPDLAIGRMTLQGAAPDWLVVQRGQNEVPLRRRELRRRGRSAERRIEAGFETGRKLLEVAFETIPGGLTVRIHHGEADRAAAEEALNGPHGGYERRAVRFREGVEERRGGLVRQAIQHRQFLAASAGERHETHARVAGRRRGAEQPLGLELSKQAAGVA